MAILPFRGLATKGIQRDPSPYELDLDTWSGGANVRFHANKVERAPVWRSVLDPLPSAPQYCVGLRPSTGFDIVVVADKTGNIINYTGGVTTTTTPTTGWTLQADPRAYTSTFLGDVVYLNRPDRAPIYYGPTSTTFAVLPNQECAWTCRSLRAFGDYLIALNVTKPTTYTDPYTSTVMTGGAIPNLVKWSDLTLDGQVPDSWDPDDPTKNTGENPLEQLTTPIVDGLPLKSIFAIYSENEIWGMATVDAQEIFTFSKLFSDGGMVAPNCAVEVNGIHYVFGPTDIYKHDGFTKVSIVDKRNKETIFRNLNMGLSEVFFVAYYPKLSTIYFCYNTLDSTAFFQGCDRCNQAYAYDLVADSGSFIDLPNISALTVANLNSVETWAQIPTSVTWNTIGGSWADQTNPYTQSFVGVAGSVTSVISPITDNQLVAYDFINKGSLSFPYYQQLNPPAFVERIGLDLDQVGSDLTTYKKVRRVYPLVVIYNNTPLEVQVGGALYPAASPSYLPPVTYYPATDYKVDVITGGRYLAIKFSAQVNADFELAGFDLDVTDNGRK